MATTRADQYTLSQDATFRQRVQASMIAAAVSISTEGAAVNYEQRKRLADKILNAPAGYASLFQNAVAGDATVANAAGSPSVQANVSDAQIDTAVAGVFNSFFVPFNG